MGRRITLGNPPIEVELRRSARARRLSLRVSRLTGAVSLTLPQRVPEAEGMAFLRDREPWLRGNIDQIAPAAVPVIGGTILLRGREMRIVATARKRVRLAGDTLEVPADRDLQGALRAFLKLSARDALAAASDRHARALGRTYQRLSLRDPRSRWGSCSSRGTLMYSWRLIMAPPDVLDYVAAHEVAHLAEMNHSPAFWRVVAGLCPDYDAHRDWLRRKGGDLHRIDLG